MVEQDQLSQLKMKVIVFQLQNEEYAIEVNDVQSIERIQQVTRVPKTYSFLIGVMNLRGVIIPVIDLRKRFNIEARNYDESTRILVISKEDMEVGLIVDGANDVIEIPMDRIEPTPEIVGGIKMEYLRGVVHLDHRLFTLIDVDKVLYQ